MPTWIISGVSGSGKSSLARALAPHLGAEYLDADDFHPPANIAKMRSGRPLDETDREAWLLSLETELRVRAGKPIVLAFPGLNASHRERMRRTSDAVCFAFLDVDLATAQARLQQRGGFFPPALAASQFEALEKDTAAYPMDGRLPLSTLTAEALAWAQPGACGVVGLGRMGLGLATRLKLAGYDTWAWDEDEAARARAKAQGIHEVPSLTQLLAKLPAPRRVLLSLPAGAVTQGVVATLLPGLQAGDLIIDAANARWQDSEALGEQLRSKGIGFVDAGVSGGVFGAQHGYCVMASGSAADYALAKSMLHAVVMPGAMLHVEPAEPVAPDQDHAQRYRVRPDAGLRRRL